MLGIWGGKGQGKTFQVNLAFKKLNVNPIVMSAGELESGNAGEPAKLIRQRYREASDVIKKGKMSSMFINDLDAGKSPIQLGWDPRHIVHCALHSMPSGCCNELSMELAACRLSSWASPWQQLPMHAPCIPAWRLSSCMHACMSSPLPAP